MLVPEANIDEQHSIRASDSMGIMMGLGERFRYCTSHFIG